MPVSGVFTFPGHIQACPEFSMLMLTLTASLLFLPKEHSKKIFSLLWSFDARSGA
jgi:hypothetical protein